MESGKDCEAVREATSKICHIQLIGTLYLQCNQNMVLHHGAYMNLVSLEKRSTSKLCHQRQLSVVIIACCLLVVGTVVSTTVLVAQKGLTRAESETVFQKNENYADIVGVDEYDKLSPLNYAVADAKRLAALFESKGYEVELLTDYKASKQRILNRIKLVAELATDGGSREQGNIVFAYSGHGFQDSAGNNYLTTSGTDPDRLSATALSMTALTRTPEQSRVRQRVLFIDACRNDPSKSVPAANRSFSLDTEAEGLAIIYSTRSGSLSWEDQDLG